MDANQYRTPLHPGEQAPAFTLPTVPDEGYVSLSDFRGKTPVLLAILRGLFCPFCRRHIAQLAVTRRKLQAVGVEVLAIVATEPERARRYYRLRPAGVPLAADPDLVTHRAYGVQHWALTPEILQVVAARHVDLARELRMATTDVGEIRDALTRQDGLEPLERDELDRRRDWSRRYGAQFTGQFLVDRQGIVRWVNFEGGVDGLSGLEQFPTDEEYLAAARALP